MDWAFGMLSGILQVSGYLYYAGKAWQRQIEPNPTSWIMWGYGTTLIFLLEADSGASGAMLILPAACALSSIAVGFICWRHGTLQWPVEAWAKASLYSDLVLTAMYVGSWTLLGNSLLTDMQKEMADITLLVIGSLSTLVTFIPMLVDTWRQPRHEQPWPWVVWTSAYAALTIATVSSPEWTWYLVLYPVQCLVLHAAVAVLSRRRALAELFRDRRRVPG